MKIVLLQKYQKTKTKNLAHLYGEPKAQGMLLRRPCQSSGLRRTISPVSFEKTQSPGSQAFSIRLRFAVLLPVFRRGMAKIRSRWMAGNLPGRLVPFPKFAAAAYPALAGAPAPRPRDSSASDRTAPIPDASVTAHC